MLPSVANALDVVDQEVLIETPDGTADNYFVHPSTGSYPGVIVWPDIRGNRPAFRAMGERLAESGYSVLVANPFYRSAKSSYGDGPFSMMREHVQVLSASTAISDRGAFVEWLDAQDAVDSDRMMGTHGYCFGGSFPFRFAAALPERIAAGASFHGGRLVTDSDDSPHLLVDQVKHAAFLIAIAEDDDAEEPDVKHVLREVFEYNGVSEEIEVYKEALHGWCTPDSAAYHEEQAERAWGRLLALYARQLV